MQSELGGFDNAAETILDPFKRMEQRNPPTFPNVLIRLNTRLVRCFRDALP